MKYVYGPGRLYSFFCFHVLSGLDDKVGGNICFTFVIIIFSLPEGKTLEKEERRGNMGNDEEKRMRQERPT